MFSLMKHSTEKSHWKIENGKGKCWDSSCLRAITHWRLFIWMCQKTSLMIEAKQNQWQFYLNETKFHTGQAFCLWCPSIKSVNTVSCTRKQNQVDNFLSQKEAFSGCVLQNEIVTVSSERDECASNEAKTTALQPPPSLRTVVFRVLL